MRGTIVQLSVSRGGIPKLAVAQAFLTPLGFEGDEHAHPGIHGGPGQALLLMTAESIDDLVSRGYPLFYGATGENLTTRGLDRRLFRTGQRYRVGPALIELTRIRVPCSTQDIYGEELKRDIYDAQVRAGDVSSPLWAMSGFYASVIEAGLIRTGDPIALESESA